MIIVQVRRQVFCWEGTTLIYLENVPGLQVFTVCGDSRENFLKMKQKQLCTLNHFKDKLKVKYVLNVPFFAIAARVDNYRYLPKLQTFIKITVQNIEWSPMVPGSL